MGFLPITKKDMAERGWDAPDFVLVSGDAYIDHPAFGTAIIGRFLESCGFRVAVLSQPKYGDAAAFTVFGRPKLAFLVTGGNVDSMVAHYTVNRRKRHDDPFTPGNKSGKRPDRAVTVYCRKIREAYDDVHIIIGGLEASLRRLAHYDYWADRVMPSILADSGADILVYGMGEKAIRKIAFRLNDGEGFGSISDVRGTAFVTDEVSWLKEEDYETLPSYEKVSRDKKAYAQMTAAIMTQSDPVNGRMLVQKTGGATVVVNPPALPLNQRELDEVYALPYEYGYPGIYDGLGGVKALEEVKFSLTHNRGCFGSCNFCSIALHQGRFVVGRSHRSVLAEAKKLTERKDFKGYLHDVGGATANFRGPACAKQEKNGSCAHKKCLYPTVCPSIKADHSDYLKLLRELRDLPKVKKVFIRSGIRYDYLLADRKQDFLHELVSHHVSGQLRVAPEHVSDAVLKCMGKPPIETYEAFSRAFYKATKRAGKEQYLLPYLISSHPGSTLKDAVELALWLKKHHLRPEQVQDFYPTPATVSTCMYYTGLDPFTMEPVFVPRSREEKQMQRALMQYWRRENADTVRKALISVGRQDLLQGKNSLLPQGKNHREKRF
ncbi:MAG TPA: YgiQ family radical SAM protein [Clostridiales bacterium]|nr:YgiQ family radical SAM protein [Clostridiales bacterium]